MEFYAPSAQEIRLFDRKFDNQLNTIALGAHFQEAEPLVDHHQPKFTREKGRKAHALR